MIPLEDALIAICCISFTFSVISLFIGKRLGYADGYAQCVIDHIEATLQRLEPAERTSADAGRNSRASGKDNQAPQT